MSRFDYVKYDAKAMAKGGEAKAMCEALDKLIQSIEVPTAPPGLAEVSRYKACARTALEETFMWIGKALRDEQRFTRGIASPDVPERTNE